MRLSNGEPAAGPWRTVPLLELVERLRAAAADVRGRPIVVALDGRSSSGKTTLSARLHAAMPGSWVVHTDDVAWWHSAFDWVEPLVDGVLEPARRGGSVTFRPPGWVARGREGAVEVPAGIDVLLVEGIGSSRRALTPWIDVSVFVQSDLDTGLARDAVRVAAGEIGPAEHEQWQAEERPFVLSDRAWERAEVVATGTPEIAYDAATEVVLAEPPGRCLHLLETGYAAVTATVTALSDESFASPTRTDWTVRELLFHLLLDAQRALVTLASPATEPADVDEVTYWAPFVPGRDPDGESSHADHVRGAAASYPSTRMLVGHWQTTAEAAVRAARAAWSADRDGRVTTQGHVLGLEDLVGTLVVEVTVHLLDLTLAVDAASQPRPGLRYTRGVLERILGGPLPAAWDDQTAVLKATGRVPLDAADHAELGAAAPRLPLLG